MKAPSSRHLSHDFPAYKGLTLRDLFVIVTATTVCTCLLFSFVGLMTGWVVAFACFGFLLGFIVAVTLLPKPIARFKAGKPHGYLMKALTLKLVTLRLKKSPYMQHKGIWQRSKSIRRPHV
jgi:conjugative transfer region protein (TIGR03750 family)